MPAIASQASPLKLRAVTQECSSCVFEHVSIPRDACRRVCRARTSDGFDLPIYELPGPARGPVVLLAHGCAMAAGSYLTLLTLLAGHARVFSYDARGHGGASRTADAPDTVASETFAADLLAVTAVVVDAAQARPHLVGHSLGGATALQAVSQAPHSFAGLTLFEPSIFPPPDHPERMKAERQLARMIASTRSRRQAWACREEFAATMQSRSAFSGLPQPALAAHVRAILRRVDGRDYRRCCSARFEAAALESVADDRLWTLLPDIDDRVVLVSADPERHDRMWITDLLSSAAERLPRGELRVIADAGHLLLLERADIACTMILDAMRRASFRGEAEGREPGIHNHEVCN